MLLYLPGLGGHSGEGVGNMGRSLPALVPPCIVGSEERHRKYCYLYRGGYVFGSVCLAVCHQDYGETDGTISMTLLANLVRGPNHRVDATTRN